MKKYELLENDTIELHGRTLYRIRALRNFGDVRKGDFGGYIAKESNLTHEENCWVYDNAKVSGNARVVGDAQVYENAVIRDNAIIGGCAEVRGGAIVIGDAHVFGNACVDGTARIFGETVVAGKANISKQSDFVVFSNVGSENGTLTIYKGKDADLLATRGCFIGTVEEFLDKSKQVHDERVHREYQLLVEMAKSRILGEK